MTLNDLIEEVAARHHEYMGGCAACVQTEGPWPCDASKLAASLTPENVAPAIGLFVHLPRVFDSYRQLADHVIAAIEVGEPAPDTEVRK